MRFPGSGRPSGIRYGSPFAEVCMSAQQGKTVAEWIAEFIVARGDERVYGLQGGQSSRSGTT